MISITLSEIERADILRQEGNDLYKSGKILRCMLSRFDWLTGRESANLVPESYTPLGNLSAAYFEVGDYTQCIIKARRALQILGESNDIKDTDLVEKLQQRIKRAEIHSFESSELKQLQARLQILDTLPRYRPTFATAKEYFCVGNDKPASLFDHTIDKNEPVSSDVSFLFGGIGDARNLLQTIIGISELEKKHHLNQKQYHLTMVDVSNNTITRDLIIFMLLEEYSNLEPSSEKAEEILSTLFYVFIAIIIPRVNFNHLYRTIDRALSLLQSSTQPLSWMHLREEDFRLYIQTLEDWKGKALTCITTANAVDKVIEELRRNTMGLPPAFRGDETVPAVFKEENKLYRATAVLIPPTRLLRNHDPAMLALLENRDSNPGKNTAAIKKHLRENWSFNTTLMYLDWYDFLEDKNDFGLANDPFHELIDFRSESRPLPTEINTPASLYDDYIAPFFQDAARFINSLSGRLQVEALCDDYVDFAEKLRFGLYRDENSLESSDATALKLIRRKDFPVFDYVGEHLSTFLYASPILKQRPTSFVRSNCLRNAFAFDDVESFLAEYQLITDTKMAQQLTSVTVLSRGEEPWPMTNYIDYGLSKPFLRQFGGLLSRKPFMKWFYALFFRFAIPYNSDLNMPTTIIISPLTLTIIFRLVAHLRSIGYPSDWMSEALLNILENKVYTTARPPRHSPNLVTEVKREHAEKHLCTLPFIQEMGTLARLFEPLLPFSLPSIPGIPKENAIFKYKFRLTNVRMKQTHSARIFNLALVFHDYNILEKYRKILAIMFLKDLRKVLDPSWGDEKDARYKGATIEDLRKKGVIVWTTVEYDVVNSVVSAWMPEAFVEKMERDWWRFGLWRVDTWENVNYGPTAVRGTVFKEEKWVNAA
ncbi:hypothetical protein BTUL_0020g00270 [Botrytis tulipae]|uniref:DUF4470 domain-containing protein n=1 Tax=Botrytis tulipae TaxID=87230 RepID=A0A4Z1F2A1_9HELO|nr:hypothetical protein BTUL_0020g00270 [Botrytis tulipae]